jgi:hypothetical protein
MKKYNTSANVADVTAVYGYSVSQTMAAVLKSCGNDLSRTNVMWQAATIRDRDHFNLAGKYPASSFDLRLQGTSAGNCTALYPYAAHRPNHSASGAKFQPVGSV